MRYCIQATTRVITRRSRGANAPDDHAPRKGASALLSLAWDVAGRSRLAPELFVPGWRELRVSHGVLNALVPKVGLQGSGIVTFVG